MFVIWRGESSGGYNFSGATQKRNSAPEELSTMSNGIKAITSDFGSEDLGSIPGWTTKGDSCGSPFCFIRLLEVYALKFCYFTRIQYWLRPSNPNLSIEPRSLRRPSSSTEIFP